MTQSAKIFEALSNTTRRRILAYLSEASLHAGDISKRFDMSKPTISRHLDILESAGLVTSERQGQYILYKLNRDNLVGELYDFLAYFCPQGKQLKSESKRIQKNKGKD